MEKTCIIIINLTYININTILCENIGLQIKLCIYLFLLTLNYTDFDDDGKFIYINVKNVVAMWHADNHV